MQASVSFWEDGFAPEADTCKAHCQIFNELIELLNQCIIAHELSFLEVDKYSIIRAEIETISSKISALRNSILKKKS